MSTDPLLAAATALLGRAPTPAEADAMAAQAARLGALYTGNLLPLRQPVEGSPGLFYLGEQDLVPILPWEGRP